MGWEMEPTCNENCRRIVTCTSCGMRKKPIGRDVAAAAGNSFCGEDCDGYRQDPWPPHLWPGESLTGEDDTATRGGK